MLFFQLVLALCGALQTTALMAPLSQLLLQRAVQTQVCYFHEFHDEPKAQWLAGFGSPAVSMEAESLSDRVCQPRYAGLNGFCDTAVDYLCEMASAETVHYSVRYELGTQRSASTALSGAPDGFAETAGAAWDMWASANHAAQSRRRNPYLAEQKKRCVEYEETLRPSHMARQLMSTRMHLAKEIQADVGALARLARGDVQQLAIDDDGGSSPLRYGSVDLCERLATREAALVAASETDDASTSRFILRMLETSPSSSSNGNGESSSSSEEEGPSAMAEEQDPLLAELAACRLTRKDALGDHARQRGLAGEWLDAVRREQPVVADSIVAYRAELYQAWADDVLRTVSSEHTDVDRLILEQQLRGLDDAAW